MSYHQLEMDPVHPEFPALQVLWGSRLDQGFSSSALLMLSSIVGTGGSRASPGTTALWVSSQALESKIEVQIPALAASSSHL